MLLRHNFLWKRVFILLDLLFLNTSFLFASYLTSKTAFFHSIDGRKTQLLIFNLFWMVLIYWRSLYDTNFKFIKTTADTLKAFIFYFFIIVSYLYIENKELFSVKFIFLFYGWLLVGLLLSRYIFILFHAIFGYFRENDRTVMIMTKTPLSLELKNIFISVNSGYNFLGFYDDLIYNTSENKELNEDNKIWKFIEYAVENSIKDIYITHLPTSNAALMNFIAEAEKNLIRLRCVPDLSVFFFRKINLHMENGIPIVSFRKEPLLYSQNAFIKRVFDIAFSVFVIIFLLSWLVPIIAVIIKLNSKGPIFFKQERWGIDNKKIMCYKFRSMVTSSNNDVDENGKYRQATVNDSRITSVGKVLRKTSLDEFPQFFNVLFGDMSIVGPRPHPIPLNLESKDTINNYIFRHAVKPGITGLAQVSGYRGETKDPELMQKRINADIWYIENWRFLLDIKIIIKTVLNVFKGEEHVF